MSLSKLALKAIGWKFVGEFPDIKKSVVVAAPHTSYMDCVIGKIILMSIGKKAKLLTWYEYFYFPLSIGLKILGCYPVGGGNGQNAILDAVDIIKNNEDFHVVICPEGQLKETDKWNPGFYYIAYKAEVPIIITSIDYKKKEVEVKSIIYDLPDKEEVYNILRDSYKDVTGRHPEKFLLPKKTN